MATFGKVDPGIHIMIIGASEKWGCLFELLEEGTVQTVNIHIPVGYAGANIKVAIYGNMGGTPANGKLYTAGEPITTVEGLNVIPVTPVILQPGFYWISWIFDADSAITYVASTPERTFYHWSWYTSEFTNPYYSAPAGFYSMEVGIYATYIVGAPPPPPPPGKHFLTVDTIPQLIIFKVTMGSEEMSYPTPITLEIEEGIVVIELPATALINNVNYVFKTWEDGSINRIRLINLLGDMTITGAYEVTTEPPPKYRGAMIASAAGVSQIYLDQIDKWANINLPRTLHRIYHSVAPYFTDYIYTHEKIKKPIKELIEWLMCRRKRNLPL